MSNACGARFLARTRMLLQSCVID